MISFVSVTEKVLIDFMDFDCSKFKINRINDQVFVKYLPTITFKNYSNQGGNHWYNNISATFAVSITR